MEIALGNPFDLENLLLPIDRNLATVVVDLLKIHHRMTFFQILKRIQASQNQLSPLMATLERKHIIKPVRIKGSTFYELISINQVNHSPKSPQINPVKGLKSEGNSVPAQKDPLQSNDSSLEIIASNIPPSKEIPKEIMISSLKPVVPPVSSLSVTTSVSNPSVTTQTSKMAVSTRIQQVLEYIQNNPKCTSAQIRKATQLSEDYIINNLAKLAAKGQVLRNKNATKVFEYEFNPNYQELKAEAPRSIKNEPNLQNAKKARYYGLATQNQIFKFLQNHSDSPVKLIASSLKLHPDGIARTCKYLFDLHKLNRKRSVAGFLYSVPYIQAKSSPLPSLTKPSNLIKAIPLENNRRLIEAEKKAPIQDSDILFQIIKLIRSAKSSEEVNWSTFFAQKKAWVVKNLQQILVVCANLCVKSPPKIMQDLFLFLGSPELTPPRFNLIVLDFNHLYKRAQAAKKSVKQVLLLLPKMVNTIPDTHPKKVLIFASKYREQFQHHFEKLGWIWIQEDKWKGEKRCDVDPILITETMDLICSDPQSIHHLYLGAGDKDYVGVITKAKKRGILTTVWAFESVDVAQEVFENAEKVEFFEK